METGRLIAIEGPDGAGKSTLAQLLVEALPAQLSQHGQQISLVREPGGTALGEAIRPLLAGQTLPGYLIDDRAEALLFLAARAQIYREVIVPRLQAGSWVIVDRGLHSTMIYQGLGRQLGLERMRDFSLFATDDIQADLVLSLQVSAATAARRLKARGEAADRIEAAGADFWQRVRQGYQRLRSWDPERVVEIDAEGEPEAALAQALRVINLHVGR